MSDFDNLPLEKLISLRAELDELIEEKRALAKDDLLAEFKEKAEAVGIDFNELVGKKSKVVPVRYRDPAKKTNTYSGRGPKPKWLQDALDAGAKLSDFKV